MFLIYKFLLESSLISTEPDDIDEVDDTCFNNNFILRRPTSFTK